MTTQIYPNLASYKIEGTDFNVLLRLVVISLFLLFIMLPLQLVVMVLYTPVAIWNAFVPKKKIKQAPLSNQVDMQVEFN